MPLHLSKTLLLVILAGCASALDSRGRETADALAAEETASANESAGDAAPAAQEPEPVTETDPIRQRLQPWHHLDESVAGSATVVVVATYRQGRYPCVSVGRTRRMPLARTFVVEERLRGEVTREDFDFALPHEPSLHYPERLREPRRYLVFLAPSRESLDRLQDPSHIYTLRSHLRTEEVVAIIDLEQTEADALDHRRRVERMQSYRQSTFTSEGWQQLRSATTIDLVEVGRYMHLIRETQLRAWSGRRDARAALGPPDATRRAGANVVDVYHLNLAARNSAELPTGTLLGRIELTYATATGALREYSEHIDIADGEIREATHDEYTRQGLTIVHVDYRR